MTTIEDLKDYYEALMEERIEERLEEAVKDASATSYREVAKKLLTTGVAIATIAECTGLSEDEIKAL